MRWYVSRNGETVGPVEETQVIEWAKGGMRGAMLRDEASPNWVPIEQSPFAQFIPPPPKPKKSWTQNLNWWQSLLIVSGLLFVVCSFGVLARRDKDDAPVATAEVTPAKAKPIEPPKPREPTLAEKIDSATELKTVIGLTQPLMNDHHGTEVGPGAALIAMWMAKQKPARVWASLESMPDSKRKEIEKDVIPFRGKKLCSRGSITQIFTDRSTGAPLYYGVLSSGWTGVVRFVAAGSTSGLVANSPAKFCGIVTGIHSYDTQIGGSTSGVEVVGLFDLKENR